MRYLQHLTAAVRCPIANVSCVNRFARNSFLPLQGLIQLAVPMVALLALARTIDYLHTIATVIIVWDSVT